MTQTSVSSALSGVRVAAAALGILAAGAASASAQTQAPSVGAAGNFALLGGQTVTNTGATTATGDVGTAPGTGASPVTGFPPGTLATGFSIHQGDAVAAEAHMDANAAYEDIAARTCTAANTLTGQNLGGQSLAPGVYCFAGAAPLTGTLTLTGTGPWIFQIAGDLTVTAAASVVAPDVTTACTGSEVFWQVGGATASIATGATFVGTVLANNAATVTTAIVDGRVLAIDGGVTTAASTVTACSRGHVVPPATSVFATGGGQIGTTTAPPSPASGREHSPTRGTTFGFIARTADASPTLTASSTSPSRFGRFNLVNHRTHRHWNGPVTETVVLATDENGHPVSVRLSGTCGTGCTFSAVAEDHSRRPMPPSHGGGGGDDDGDHHRPRDSNDRFGYVIVTDGTVTSSSATATIERGNIRIHEQREHCLSTDLDDVDFEGGRTMTVSATLTRGAVPVQADAYVVLELPNGQYLSWTGAAFVPGLVPIARSVTTFDYRATIAQVTIPYGTPQGTYIWLSALAAPGTLNLISPISQTVFTITQ